MDVFNNCRICLRGINHEPIKMTRLILKFLEKSLHLTNVTKPNQQGNAKQNLCAPCFNRISEFQDFLEQCKDSDEFWKAQFEDLKEIPFDKQLTFGQTVLLPLIEDSNSLEADTTVSTTEKRLTYIQPEEKENTIHPPQMEVEYNHEKEEIMLPTSSQIKEKETNQSKSFNTIDLTNWTEDTNNPNREIQTPTHSECDANIKNLNEEIIEYEYQIEEDEEVEITEIPNIDESASSDACGIDYPSFAYEQIETGSSSKSTVIDQTNEETVEEHSETTSNSYSYSTTIDENGKVKMSYKCQLCDKSFNRVYDIESHYNIHNGVKPFTCNVCGKSFRQKNILTTHQTLHFGKKVECAECGKKFARRSQLILHYRMHRDEKPFVCNFDGCQAAFRQRKQLIDHSFIHTNEKNFKCATCSKSFHTRKRLQDHLYKVHSQHRYCCELCEKAFLKPHMLKHHMITAHNVEVDDVSHLKILVDVSKPTKKSSR